jgi:uncharacterized spore protein YtfJ
MTITDSTTASFDEVIESIKGTRDTISVGRAYGEAYELDGVTVIPVARVSGGAGGGGGEGADEQQSGGGFGTGFGLHVSPVGVYEVRGSQVTWKPTVDVNRLLRGGQVLTGLVVVCITILRLTRRR